MVQRHVESANEPVLRVVCMSDTHQLHRELEVPTGDILIHAGDFTLFGRTRQSIRDFNDWLGGLPHQSKIVVPGNHEFALEADPSLRDLLSNATVLVNESCEVGGLRIWGSPVTDLYGGAFGSWESSERKRVYDRIPPGTDVLVTHAAPLGILDSSPGSALHAGCPILLDAVMRINPLVHVFGHVHAGYGTALVGNTRFVNAALVNEEGDIGNQPIVIDLPLCARRRDLS